MKTLPKHTDFWPKQWKDRLRAIVNREQSAGATQTQALETAEAEVRKEFFISEMKSTGKTIAENKQNRDRKRNSHRPHKPLTHTEATQGND